jgi:hypothetical protein
VDTTRALFRAARGPKCTLSGRRRDDLLSGWGLVAPVGGGVGSWDEWAYIIDGRDGRGGRWG